MQRIDLPLSTLCYVAGTSTANWINADDFCFANFRASLCTLTQWRLAVCRAGASTPGRTWTATPSGSASFVSITACTADGVATQAASTQLFPACCAEWPRF